MLVIINLKIDFSTSLLLFNYTFFSQIKGINQNSFSARFFKRILQIVLIDIFGQSKLLHDVIKENLSSFSSEKAFESAVVLIFKHSCHW